jgi:hypothetical protein
MDWLKKVELRSRARVPIINLTHQNQLECDISFGLAAKDTSELVRALKEECGLCLMVISSFLKVLLAQLELDQPFTGGLGSFKLYLMITLHRRHYLAQRKLKASQSMSMAKSTRRPNKKQKTQSDSQSEPSGEELAEGPMDYGDFLISFLYYYGNPRNLNQSVSLYYSEEIYVSMEYTRLVREIQEAFFSTYVILSHLRDEKEKARQSLQESDEKETKECYSDDSEGNGRISDMRDKVKPLPLIIPALSASTGSKVTGANTGQTVAALTNSVQRSALNSTSYLAKVINCEKLSGQRLVSLQSSRSYPKVTSVQRDEMARAALEILIDNIGNGYLQRAVTNSTEAGSNGTSPADARANAVDEMLTKIRAEHPLLLARLRSISSNVSITNLAETLRAQRMISDGSADSRSALLNGLMEGYDDDGNYYGYSSGSSGRKSGASKRKEYNFTHYGIVGSQLQHLSASNSSNNTNNKYKRRKTSQGGRTPYLYDQTVDEDFYPTSNSSSSRYNPGYSGDGFGPIAGDAGGADFMEKSKKLKRNIEELKHAIAIQKSYRSKKAANSSEGYHSGGGGGGGGGYKGNRRGGGGQRYFKRR